MTVVAIGATVTTVWYNEENGFLTYSFPAAALTTTAPDDGEDESGEEEDDDKDE